MNPTKLSNAFMHIAPEGVQLTEEDTQFALALWKPGSGDEMYQNIATAIYLKNVIEKEDSSVRFSNEEFIQNAIQIKELLVNSNKKTTTCHFLAKRLLTEKKLLNAGKTAEKVKALCKITFLDRLRTTEIHQPIQGVRIGKGVSGIVYRVNQIGEKAIHDIAMKVSLSNEYSEADLKSEMACLKRIHASTKLTDEEKLKLMPEPIEIEYEGKIGFLTTFYQGGNLKDYLSNNNLSVDQKIEIAKQLIEQMAILSKEGLVYTDIKLENVFVDPSTNSPTVHLADFGNCFFTDTPETFSGHYLFTSIMQDDHINLLRPHLGPVSERSNALTAASHAHMTRGLAILLIEMFTMSQFRYTDSDEVQGYSANDLLKYLRENPLEELEDHDPSFRALIYTMMMGEMTPLDVWNRV